MVTIGPGMTGWVFSKRYGRKKHVGYVSMRKHSRVARELLRKAAQARRRKETEGK